MMRRAVTWVLIGTLCVPPSLLIALSLARDWPFPSLFPQSFEMRQWSTLLTPELGIRDALLTSSKIGLAVAMLATAGGFMTSRRVAGHPRRGPLIVLAHLPFAISPVVVGVTLLFAYIWLGLAGTVPGVVLAQLPFAYAYAVLLLTGFWNRQVADLGGVARTLGANPRQLWLRVFLPRAASMLGVCLFQTFLISWFDYPLVLLIGGGKVQTLTVKVFEYFGSGDVRLASACSLLLMLPPAAVLILNRGALRLRFVERSGDSYA